MRVRRNAVQVFQMMRHVLTKMMRRISDNGDGGLSPVAICLLCEKSTISTNKTATMEELESDGPSR